VVALVCWSGSASVRSNAVGYGVLASRAVLRASALRSELPLIVTKPDNVPIVGLIFLLVFFVWYSMREAVLNDRRIAAARADRESGVRPRLGVARPRLHRAHLADLCSVVLIVWSIFLKAPLEQPANRANTPNPSKAPWYFLGLQEMLVYFDPWLAGVVLPGLDHRRPDLHSLHRQEPEGNGYYTFNERKAEITIFPVRLRRPVVVAHRARHVPARTELELLRAVRVLGHSQARGADQRRSVGILLGADARAGMPTNYFIRELPGILLVLVYVLVCRGAAKGALIFYR
jgi:hypothetical protein